MKKNIKKTLSLIIPCFNEEENIIPFYNMVESVFNLNDKYEIVYIFINDGSTDDTYKNLLSLYNSSSKNIVIVDFLHNFGKEAAIYAGISNTNYGEYVCIIDSDMQQDPKYIIKMLDILEN